MLLIFLVALFSRPDVDLRGAEPQVASKIERLMQKVQAKSDSTDAWGNLAMNLHIHDYRQEAVAAYERASTLNPENFRWKYLRAVALQEIGASESVKSFRQAIQLKEDYTPARLRLAQVLMEAGKATEAQSEFENTLKDDPRDAHAYLGLARLALTDGDLKRSAEDASKAVKLNHNLSEAHGILAEIYRRSGETQKMINELKLSQQLPQKLGPADPILLDLVREGVSSYWYQERGRSLIQQRQYSAAVGELQNAARARPDARIYELLGIAYQSQNKNREAIEQYRKAIELKPDSAASWNNLASVYASLAERQKAIECFQKALDLSKAQSNFELQKSIESSLKQISEK